jgi:hypothetical protein
MFDNIIKFPHDASRRTVTQRRRASSNGFSSFSNDAVEKIREMAMQILLGHVGTGSQTPSISGYPFASFGIAAAPWGRDAVRPRSHLSMMGHPSASSIRLCQSNQARSRREKDDDPGRAEPNLILPVL